MKAITIRFEKDGSLCVENNGVSREEFIKAAQEFAKKNGKMIVEIEQGEK